MDLKSSFISVTSDEIGDDITQEEFEMNLDLAEHHVASLEVSSAEFIKVLERIDEDCEEVVVSQEAALLLLEPGEELVSFEAVQSEGYSFNPMMFIKRLRQVYATNFIENHDAIGDLFRKNQSMLNKYRKKLYATRALIKGKSIDQSTYESEGTLAGLVTSFHSNLGIASDITSAIDDDIAMSDYVFNKYPDSVAKELDTYIKLITKERFDRNTTAVNTGQYAKIKHPVDLFEDKWIGQKIFLRGTGFKIAGKWDPSRTGLDRLGQRAYVMPSFTPFTIASTAMAALVGQRSNIIAPDIRFTVKDVYRTIDQGFEYIDTLEKHAKSITQYRKLGDRVKAMKPVVSEKRKIDPALKEDIGNIIAMNAVLTRSIFYPTIPMWRRTIPVIRAIAYLANRMAKYAK